MLTPIANRIYREIRGPILPVKIRILIVLGKRNLIILLKLKVHITFNPVVSFLETYLIKSKC